MCHALLMKLLLYIIRNESLEHSLALIKKSENAKETECMNYSKSEKKTGSLFLNSASAIPATSRICG